MALMQVTVIPLGTQSPGVGEYIADIIAVLDREGFPYELTDMGTTIAGPPEDLFPLAAKLHNVPFEKGVKRVVTHITLDDRRDKTVSLGEKIAAVKAHLA